MNVIFEHMVPVVPVAQPRHRHTQKDGIDVNYIPSGHPITDFKAQTRLLVYQRMHDLRQEPFEGPLVFGVRFFLPRPKRLLTKKSFDGAIPHTGKPDLGNLVKGTEDAMKGVLWRDDSQVYEYGKCGKYYCEKDGIPRVELRLVRE